MSSRDFDIICPHVWNVHFGLKLLQERRAELQWSAATTLQVSRSFVHTCQLNTCAAHTVHMFVSDVFSFVAGCVCVLHTHGSSTSRLKAIWFVWRGPWSCSGQAFKEGLGQQWFLPTYTLINGARPSASNSIGRASWLPPKPPKLIYPTFSLLLPLKWGLL